MPDYWLGVITPFAVIGGLAVAGGLIWLTVVMLPEGIWWTVKRLPLHDQWSRERAASVIGAARRAYTLRIPFGVRLTLSLGESYETRDAVLEQLRQGREATKSGSIDDKERTE